jgi:hypothetical protein
MLRIGMIQSSDSCSGTLIDTKGFEYFFDASECQGDYIPPRGTIVSFHRDPDYKQTHVAMLVCKCEEVLSA